MYEASNGKCDVTIQCYGPAPYSEQVRVRKRQQSEGTEGASAPKASCYDAHVDKMAEVVTLKTSYMRSTLESIMISIMGPFNSDKETLVI